MNEVGDDRVQRTWKPLSIAANMLQDIELLCGNTADSCCCCDHVGKGVHGIGEVKTELITVSNYWATAAVTLIHESK